MGGWIKGLKFTASLPVMEGWVISELLYVLSCCLCYSDLKCQMQMRCSVHLRSVAFPISSDNRNEPRNPQNELHGRLPAIQAPKWRNGVKKSRGNEQWKSLLLILKLETHCSLVNPNHGGITSYMLCKKIWHTNMLDSVWKMRQNVTYLNENPLFQKVFRRYIPGSP